jgi:hypothetical protein
MFNEINQLILNDIKNYNKRQLTKSTIDLGELGIIQAYTEMYAKNERNLDIALNITRRLDKRLHDRIEHIGGYGIYISISDDFLSSLYELQSIDEALTHEEYNNLGFGNDAKILRKKWRRKLREINKTLDKWVRNRILWIKEWSKPRKTYILNGTGEVHNGLYWTIRAYIDCPQMIKYGFVKEDK